MGQTVVSVLSTNYIIYSDVKLKKNQQKRVKTIQKNFYLKRKPVKLESTKFLLLEESINQLIKAMRLSKSQRKQRTWEKAVVPLNMTAHSTSAAARHSS